MANDMLRTTVDGSAWEHDEPINIADPMGYVARETTAVGTLIITVADNFGHKAQRVIRDFTDTPVNRVAARKALWAEIDAEAMGLVGGCFVASESFRTDAETGQAYPAGLEGVIQSW